MLRIRVLTALFSSAFLFGTALAQDQPHFTTLDFPGAVATKADGISPGGEIVGHYTDTAGTEHGFLLSRGQFTSIDYPGAIYTDARGISPDGDIVGSYTNAPGGPANRHGYLLSRGTFSEVQVTGYLGTIAQRITPEGEIYGCSHDYDYMSNMRGFVRNPAGGYTVLDVPSSMNNGATPDGRVIVGLYNDLTTGATHGYFLRNGNFEPFDVPGSISFTEGWDINPSEDVAGDFQDNTGKLHGFLLSRGAFTTIDFPGAVATSAVGINPAGDIVGPYTDSSGKTHAFLRSVTGRE
jgi:uncharacterized membrane protein